MSRSSKPLPLPLTVLFAPSERVALERGGYTATRNKLVLSVLNNVKSQLVSLSVQPDGRWREDEATAPAIEGVSVSAVDAEEGDDVWLTSWSYLTPTTLSLADVSGGVGPMRHPNPNPPEHRRAQQRRRRARRLRLDLAVGD